MFLRFGVSALASETMVGRALKDGLTAPDPYSAIFQSVVTDPFRKGVATFIRCGMKMEQSKKMGDGVLVERLDPLMKQGTSVCVRHIVPRPGQARPSIGVW